MPGQVERWLETFMCKQYAETFEAYGFKTLQSVSCSCVYISKWRPYMLYLLSKQSETKMEQHCLNKRTYLVYLFQLCQLQLPQLQIMGVAQEHCEHILDNVDILRQSLGGMILAEFAILSFYMNTVLKG